jgi:hypothetical protein
MVINLFFIFAIDTAANQQMLVLGKPFQLSLIQVRLQNLARHERFSGPFRQLRRKSDL